MSEEPEKYTFGSVLDNAVSRKDKNPTGNNSVSTSSAEEDIARLRKMISLLLQKFEQQVISTDMESDSAKNLWGEKESAISILTKLTQMMLKLAPNNDISAKEKTSHIDSSPLSKQEDIKILERYVNRRLQGKGNRKDL